MDTTKYSPLPPHSHTHIHTHSSRSTRALSSVTQCSKWSCWQERSHNWGTPASSMTWNLVCTGEIEAGWGKWNWWEPSVHKQGCVCVCVCVGGRGEGGGGGGRMETSVYTCILVTNGVEWDWSPWLQDLGPYHLPLLPQCRVTTCVFSKFQ